MRRERRALRMVGETVLRGQREEGAHPRALADANRQPIHSPVLLARRSVAVVDREA